MAHRYRRDILAEITLLSSEEGGRSTPVHTGYCPQICYDGSNYNGAFQEYIDTEIVRPGQTVIAFLTFLIPEIHIGKLFPGQDFLVTEGKHIVGKGRIIEILNPTLTAKNCGKAA